MLKDVTKELRIGCRYRIGVRAGACRGSLEGQVRSLDLPAGVLGNVDGYHRIWVAGRLCDWFLRLDEVESVEELGETSTEVEATYCRPFYEGLRSVFNPPRKVAVRRRR